MWVYFKKNGRFESFFKNNRVVTELVNFLKVSFLAVQWTKPRGKQVGGEARLSVD